MTPSGKGRTCSSPSARRPGRISSPAPCSPSNCSGRRASLRTIPIIAKDRGVRYAPLLAVAALALVAGYAAHATAGASPQALRAALREAQAADARAQGLEQRAQGATNAATRARAENAALAAR